MRQHVRVLGSGPVAAITITDGVRTGAAGPTDVSVIAVAAPFWFGGRGRRLEVAVTRAVASAFWRREIPCGADGDWFVEGLARFTATSSLASQYDDSRDSPAIGADERRYAGGFLSRVLRATVPASGSSMSAYRADPRVDPAHPRSARDRDVLEAKTALAAETLSAWIGGPTWEAALRSFVTASRGRCGSWRELSDAASDVTGLDFSWFFDQVFGTVRVFDYGVERLASEPVADSAGRYRTALVVRRYGDGIFTGSAEPPIAPFESGRGVEIALRFADGTERTDHWDGRAASRTFDYQSSSPAVSATVDPREVILLDLDRTNNSRTLPSRTASAATRWSVTLDRMVRAAAALVRLACLT